MNQVTVALIEALFSGGVSGDICRAAVCRVFLRGEYFDLLWSMATIPDMGRRWRYER